MNYGTSAPTFMAQKKFSTVLYVKDIQFKKIRFSIFQCFGFVNLSYGSGSAGYGGQSRSVIASYGSGSGRIQILPPYFAVIQIN